MDEPVSDGFTLYYQHAAGLAGLFWTVAGLVILRRLLLRHFTDRVTAATLATVLLGTNLYHYATFDSSYSHAYSFFLFSLFLDLTERWHGTRDWTRSVLLGVTARPHHPDAAYEPAVPDVPPALRRH